MDKLNTTELIKSLYKILLLYEDMQNEDSTITEKEYIGYLERVGVRFLGRKSSEIYDIIQGLICLGANIKHNEIKSIVFHMIDLVGKGV